ncbi:hypothetical protein [Bacillus rhizoplanae]|uniref:hypothetical protein n=1 Tax=Bacillus rhizoplanae TaxID=2880966 RepID=UPI003D196765
MAEELREYGKEKNELHEFRAPLTFIMENLYLLCEYSIYSFFKKLYKKNKSKLLSVVEGFITARE